MGLDTLTFERLKKASSLAWDASGVEELDNAVDHLNVFIPVASAISAVRIQGRATHNPFDIQLVEVMLAELSSKPVAEILWPESCDVLTSLG